MYDVQVFDERGVSLAELRKGSTMSAVAVSPRTVRAGFTTGRVISRTPRTTGASAPTSDRVTGSSVDAAGQALQGGTARQARMQLTARGRRVAALIVLLVVGVVLLAGRAAAADDSGPLEVQSYTVATGDTLWEIASRVTTPGEDIRDVVLRLEELNRMSSVDLRAGEQILIPSRP